MSAHSTLIRAALATILALVACASDEPVEVRFPTSDGGIVGAHLYGQGSRWVVLVHGARFDKESWSDEARTLARAGYRVLAIDMRGRGISQGGSEEDAERFIHLDVLAAIEHARTNGATSVSLIGASLGGWAAGQAAVEAPPGAIDRLVLLAATGVREPDRMQGHKLFVVSREDRTGSGRQRLENIRVQYERATEPKKLRVLDGDAHAQFLFDSPQGEELMEEILRFLDAP